MFSVLVLAAVLGCASAKFAFPVPSYYAIEKAFRTVRPAIKWDPTNQLTDLAGPLAMCDRLTDWGPAGKKTPAQAETVWNAAKIDPVFFPAKDSYSVYYFILSATGADSRAVHNDINSAVQNMQRANFQGAPFTELNSDLQSTVRFGCSVEPQCPTSGTPLKTVVVCLLLQANIPPEFFVKGFNETWGSHSHDVYSTAADTVMPEGHDFPGYIYKDDEIVVKEVVGQDLCDKHVYDPNGYVTTIRNYWVDQSPPFQYPLGASKSVGWYLGMVVHPNASSLGFMWAGDDNTVPVAFKVGVINKLFKNPDKNTIVAKSSPIDVNTGACVMAICPNRYLPRGGTAGGKLTTKGNFAVCACMLFKTDEAISV